jgi:hypothetical protein
VQAVVVHDELLVDVQQRAVITDGFEAIRAVGADGELAAPTHHELVGHGEAVDVVDEARVVA